MKKFGGFRKMSYLCIRNKKDKSHIVKPLNKRVMSKVTIINELENGLELIETNVPINAIKDFLDEYGAANKPKDSKEEDKSDIVSYIKKKYPKFYEGCKEGGILDKSFDGAIGLMAQEMEISKEDVIDKLLDVAQADGLMGVIGAHLAAEALAIATVRWRKENEIEE